MLVTRTSPASKIIPSSSIVPSCKHVKVRKIVPVLNYAVRHEKKFGRPWCEWSASGPGHFNPSNQCIGGWGDRKTCLSTEISVPVKFRSAGWLVALLTELNVERTFLALVVIPQVLYFYFSPAELPAAVSLSHTASLLGCLAFVYSLVMTVWEIKIRSHWNLFNWERQNIKSIFVIMISNTPTLVLDLIQIWATNALESSTRRGDAKSGQWTDLHCHCKDTIIDTREPLKNR